MVAIYNQSVAVNTASWDTEPQTVPERRAWFEERSAAGQAILIAEVAGRVVGWARRHTRVAGAEPVRAAASACASSSCCAYAVGAPLRCTSWATSVSGRVR